MQNFFDQLLSGDVFAILVVVWVIIRLILGVIEAVGTRNTSKLKKSVQEVYTMVSKFRLPNYQDTDKEAVKANKQTFTKYSPTYVYNEDTKELKRAMNDKTGEFYDKDDQAYIDSFANTALDKVLERFLPQDYARVVPPFTDDQCDSDSYAEVVNKVVDSIPDDVSEETLTDYDELVERANSYIKKYNLDPSMPILDVFDYVDKLNNRYQERMSRYKSKKSSESNIPKVEQVEIDYDKLAQTILSKAQGGQKNA